MPNELCKFTTRNWVEINDESQGKYNGTNQIKFKTSMIRPNLCDYTDAYIHVKGTIEVPNTGKAAASSNRNKNVIFKNRGPLIKGMLQPIFYIDINTHSDRK